MATVSDIDDILSVSGDDLLFRVDAAETVVGPLSYSATGLPGGATLDTSTGVLTATFVAGLSITEYDVEVTVTEPGAPDASTTFKWVVVPNRFHPTEENTLTIFKEDIDGNPKPEGTIYTSPYRYYNMSLGLYPTSHLGEWPTPFGSPFSGGIGERFYYPDSPGWYNQNWNMLTGFLYLPSFWPPNTYWELPQSSNSYQSLAAKISFQAYDVFFTSQYSSVTTTETQYPDGLWTRNKVDTYAAVLSEDGLSIVVEETLGDWSDDRGEGLYTIVTTNGAQIPPPSGLAEQVIANRRALAATGDDRYLSNEGRKGMATFENYRTFAFSSLTYRFSDYDLVARLPTYAWLSKWVFGLTGIVWDYTEGEVRLENLQFLGSRLDTNEVLVVDFDVTSPDNIVTPPTGDPYFQVDITNMVQQADPVPGAESILTGLRDDYHPVDTVDNPYPISGWGKLNSQLGYPLHYLDLGSLGDSEFYDRLITPLPLAP